MQLISRDLQKQSQPSLVSSRRRTFDLIAYTHRSLRYQRERLTSFFRSRLRPWSFFDNLPRDFCTALLFTIFFFFYFQVRTVSTFSRLNIHGSIAVITWKMFSSLFAQRSWTRSVFPFELFWLVFLDDLDFERKIEFFFSRFFRVSPTDRQKERTNKFMLWFSGPK